jgi:hypothetical protein
MELLDTYFCIGKVFALKHEGERAMHIGPPAERFSTVNTRFSAQRKSTEECYC